MSDGDWEAWQTWSETIAGGFRGAPDLCEHIDNNAAAYSSDFVFAIEDSEVCTIVVNPPTNTG
jgi:hypothetical protein